MNIKEQESGKVNAKSGKVVAKSKRLPKGHADYWKDKVRKLTYKKDGVLIEATNYSLRLQSLGRREFFNLNTANKSTAAQQAKQIHAFLVSNGWEATLTKFKPEAEAKAEIETVGDLIAKASKEAEVRPLTLRQYIGALRRVVGAIKGIKSDDASKYQPGGSEWQQRVDRVKLAQITPEKVKEWRNKQIAKLNPEEVKKKQVSVNSTLNQARSIWKHSDDASPFDGLKWKQTAKRFKPTVDAPTLLYWAVEELDKQKPELFKAFILCLYLGLRKGEADCLAWEQIDFEGKRLRIETTKHFQPKSENSEREIPIQESILETVSRWRKGADLVFVLNGGDAKPNVNYTYYRASGTWDQLTAWLRSKGVESPKPIHYLRKLSGSLMYANNDVYAAQRFLGHSDIRTTIGSYLHEGDNTFDIVAKKPEPTEVEAS
jgi:integrase